jgi:hypothetical protein
MEELNSFTFVLSREDDGAVAINLRTILPYQRWLQAKFEELYFEWWPNVSDRPTLGSPFTRPNDR